MENFKDIIKEICPHGVADFAFSQEDGYYLSDDLGTDTAKSVVSIINFMLSTIWREEEESVIYYGYNGNHYEPLPASIIDAEFEAAIKEYMDDDDPDMPFVMANKANIIALCKNAVKAAVENHLDGYCDAYSYTKW